MRFSKSGAVLAIVFAAAALGGNTAYAESTDDVVVARDPSQTQTVTPKTTETSATTVTVQQGDTLSAIASAHGTTVAKLVELNAIADPNMVSVGAVLQVPSTEGSVPADTSAEGYDQLKAAASAFITPPAPVATTTSTARATSTSSSSVRYAGGSSAGNSYVWGTCTWYVKERKPNIPNMLGNGGYGWLSTAAAAGYATGSTPVAGAIGVESGHVVIIESVNANGTVNISEMNYAGGVGVVHYRTTPASEFQYIYA